MKADSLKTLRANAAPSRIDSRAECCATGTAKDKPNPKEIPLACAHLSEAVSQLDQAVEVLEDVLRPVLRPIPSEKDAFVETKPSTELGAYITDQTTRVWHMTSRVRSLLERLEV